MGQEGGQVGQGQVGGPDMTAEDSAWETIPHTSRSWSGGGLEVGHGRLCPAKNPRTQCQGQNRQRENPDEEVQEAQKAAHQRG